MPDYLPNKAFAWVNSRHTTHLALPLPKKQEVGHLIMLMQKAKLEAMLKLTCLDYDFGQGISVNTSVNNLFDKSYEYTNGYIEEGRNYC